jgi:hypothetical protein
MLPKDREVVASIQALRAIAVVFVVLNHFFPHHLSGGYIGVDIFFVVSGFLISSHLLRELKGGSLNFSRFYLRRARRLLPASLLVLALTCIAISLSMPSAWQVANLKDAAAAAVYGVNWRFAANAVNYFADSGFLSPVNHYWSLSVEEQFYLVWPALLYFSLRIAIARTRRTAESLIPAVIGVLMATILALSLISAILAIHHSPSAAYFLTFTRAWEFAAGGLAGLMLGKLKNQLADAHRFGPVSQAGVRRSRSCRGAGGPRCGDRPCHRGRPRFASGAPDHRFCTRAMARRHFLFALPLALAVADSCTSRPGSRQAENRLSDSPAWDFARPVGHHEAICRRSLPFSPVRTRAYGAILAQRARPCRLFADVGKLGKLRLSRRPIARRQRDRCRGEALPPFAESWPLLRRARDRVRRELSEFSSFGRPRFRLGELEDAGQCVSKWSSCREIPTFRFMPE